MFYRLRQALKYTRFKFATGIMSSPPVACLGDAQCAIHTMLGARDLPLYLAAIKSFLRFCPEVGVVVHSDGTLSKRDEAIVRHHVRGCKVISAAEADARAEAVLDHGSRLY